MPEDKQDGKDNVARMVKKLTLPDGFQVGIIGLNNILKEVADMKLVDAGAIKSELLKSVLVNNYIPSGSEAAYGAALFREYQQKFGGPGAVRDGGITERHRHTKG